MSIKYWFALVALICLQAPALAAERYGTAPIDPSAEDDEHFVVDKADKLDTGCTSRSGSPLIFKVKVNRYVGPTNTDGTLLNLQTLIDNGVVSKYAELVMPAFDVDSSADIDPEIDKVFFNGKSIGQLTGRNNHGIEINLKYLLNMSNFLLDLEQ